jgi:hypothetical protein
LASRRIVKWEDYPFTIPIHKMAMPWLSDIGSDFGLGKKSSNRKKLNLYLQNESEIIEEDKRYKFFLSGSWKNGCPAGMARKVFLNLEQLYLEIYILQEGRNFGYRY